jgi:hypothetical protein
MNDRNSTVPGAGGFDGLERERQRALDSITTAFASGKISIEEYETRAEKIQKSIALADIESETFDLPQPEPPRYRDDSQGARSPAASFRRPSPVPRNTGAYMVETRGGSPEFALCVMGDRRMTGDWLNSDQATSFTLMGSTTLDLRDTALPPGRLRIDAVAIMGEVRVIVPEGVPVKMSAFPFMGEANVARGVPQRVLDRDQPWVEISGIALMGSIVVKTA